MNENEGSDPNGNEKHKQDAVEGSVSRVPNSSIPEAARAQLQSDDSTAGADQGVEQRGQSDQTSDGSAEGTVTFTGAQVEAFMHSGPLPAVSEFAGYNQVLPGAADRILSMAEKSLDMEVSDRQREGENKRANQDDENWALKVAAFGFTFLPWMGFLVSAFSAAMGQQAASTIAALVGAVTAGPQMIEAVKKKRK
ncbi:MAG: DUF2335 domain-containing protein [Bifidobacterium crudilactis]|jgi:uncharacterized membrane protein|nr:DUF2335 domain-containing protein [Bifidobacterium crudilactis]MCI1889611.1 DUF2335 domain-containing protein [Bifidobacterium crudilactis]